MCAVTLKQICLKAHECHTAVPVQDHVQGHRPLLFLIATCPAYL